VFKWARCAQLKAMAAGFFSASSADAAIMGYLIPDAFRAAPHLKDCHVVRNLHHPLLAVLDCKEDKVCGAILLTRMRRRLKRRIHRKEEG
jgi:hypothetical protein